MLKCSLQQCLTATEKGKLEEHANTWGRCPKYIKCQRASRIRIKITSLAYTWGKMTAYVCMLSRSALSMGFSRQEYWSGLPSLLRRIFPTQGSNLSLFHCRWILYHQSYQGGQKNDSNTHQNRNSWLHEVELREFSLCSSSDISVMDFDFS